MALIKPSHREKRRYILIEASEDLKQKFFDTFIHFFGIYGLAKAGAWFVEDLCRDNFYVLRVARGYISYAIIVIYLTGGEIKGVFPTLRKLKSFMNKLKQI